MQWELAGLSGCSAEDENADASGYGKAEDGGVRDERVERGGLEAAGAVIVEEQCAGLVVEPGDAEEEADIADARDEEGFFRGGRGGGVRVPEADEEIGSEADDLPAHEEKQKTVRDDDAKHGAGEKGEEAEEAREVFVVLHVADAVDEDEQADEGDHQEHDDGERAEEPADANPVAAVLKPIEVEGLFDIVAVADEERVREGDDGEQER